MSFHDNENIIMILFFLIMLALLKGIMTLTMMTGMMIDGEDECEQLNDERATFSKQISLMSCAQAMIIDQETRMK